MYKYSACREKDIDEKMIENYEEALKHPWKHDKRYVSKAYLDLSSMKRARDKKRRKQEAEAKAYRERFEK